MSKYSVSIARYDENDESVKKAIEQADALKHMPSNARVFIKPNIVFWTRETVFPKWGVITTSRIIEDVIRVLKDKGINDITIGEGIVSLDPKDRETAKHAFEYLGYTTLQKKYGIKYLDVFTGNFEKVMLSDDIELEFSEEALNSDFIVNLPTLKTHAQTKVSLGIKNLKGLLNIKSRKKCHSDISGLNLNFMIAKIPEKLPPVATIYDGLYTLERGPSFNGKPRPSKLIMATADILSGDLVGAQVLGYSPAEIPHLVAAAKNAGRPIDCSDIEVTGETISSVASKHEYNFPYNEDNTLPKKLDQMGVTGLTYHKYDDTMCTYCSALNGAILAAITFAWKGEPWDNVEVLTGKLMKPTPGMNKTILLGQCMFKLNKENQDIREMIPIKGCPPKPADAVAAFHQAGIAVDPAIFENLDKAPGFFMTRYQDKPEFEERFFQVAD